MKKMCALAITFVLASAGSGGASDEPPAGAHGYLVREGRPLRLDGRHLHIAAKRCREQDIQAISVSVSLYPADTPYHVDEVLFSISGDCKAYPVGQKTMLSPEKLVASAAPASMLAWISGPNRGSEAALPASGWLRFDRLERLGPVDVSFHANFGKLGDVEGRLQLDKTEEVVCRSPAPSPRH